MVSQREENGTATKGVPGIMVQTSKTTVGSMAPARAVTEDSGRIHLGGGMVSFDNTKVRDEIKDAGRTKLGGGMVSFDDTKVRDEIKDAGRTKLGGGMISF
jgi:hypothetical protein